MIKTKSKIAQIVTSASYLSEHLNNRSIEVNTDQTCQQQTVDEYIAHWCQVVAQGDWEKFQQRLSWDGLNIDKVRHVLASVGSTEVCSLPSWA